MYHGVRRPYEDFGEDTFAKRRKTDNIWDDGEAQGPQVPLPTPPPFPYANVPTYDMTASAYDMTSYDNGSAGMSYDNNAGHSQATWNSGGYTGWGQGDATGNWGGGYGGGSSWGVGKQSSGGGGGRGGGGRGAYSRGGRARGRGKGGDRGGKAFGGGGSSEVFTDDMALIEAAEREYNQNGTVDFNKIRQALAKMSGGGGGRGARGTRGARGVRGGRGTMGGWNQGPQSYDNSQSSFRGGRGRGKFTATPYDKAAGFGGGGQSRGFVRGGQRGVRGAARSRGGRAGFGSVAPVHSLAKISTVDPSTMSMAERIRRFALFIQNDSQKVNDIQMIENGLTGSKLNLKPDYMVEELMRVCNKMMFTGRLFISGVFMARSVGANKKEVKHECFRKTVELLKTKTVVDIMKMEDVGTEKMREELVASLQNQESVNPMADAQKKVEVLEQKVKVKEAASPGATGVEGGFFKLIKYLQGGQLSAMNAISELMQAFSASGCALMNKYVEDFTRLYDGNLWFKGSLTINDILIASDSSHKKKEAKMKTFEKALVFLKTKPVHVIMRGVSPEEAEAVPVQEFLSQASTGPGQDDPALRPNEDTLSKLRTLVQNLPAFPGAESVVNLLDVTATQTRLIPTCAYRKGNGEKVSVICELYIDNILISVGESEKRKDAQSEAYTSALTVLAATPPDIIYNDFKRFDADDSKNLVEVVVKGRSRSGESNLPRLKKMHMDPSKNDKGKDDIVIIEHHEWAFDRKRQAFGILNLSATQNNMLLEWKIHPVGTFFKCEMYIQKEKVGEACAPSKNVSRNLAAADALFKLFQTQTTIKVVSRVESEFWFTYETIKEKAEEMKKVMGGASSGSDIVTVKSEFSKGGESSGDEADAGKTPGLEPLKADKWVLQVLEEMIEKFSRGTDLEELLFSPGYPMAERRFITQTAKTYDLRYASRQNKDDTYTSVFRKYLPDKMVEILTKNGGHSGKYSIIPKPLLPKHEDIVEQLRSHGKTAVVSKQAVVKQALAQGANPSTNNSMDSSGDYTTARSMFYESSPGQMSFGGGTSTNNTPFGTAVQGNSSFQTSTPRGSGRGMGRGKRARGKSPGNSFGSGDTGWGEDMVLE